VGINHLGRHWRRTHRSEDQPLFARELRRKTYQKRKEQLKEGQVIHIMEDGTMVTLGMLERLITAEKEVGPTTSISEVLNPEGPLAARLKREEERHSPLTEVDKKTHLPDNPVEEELV